MATAFYVVRNKKTGKLAAAIRWSHGKVDSVHLLTNRKAARDIQYRNNLSTRPHRPWQIVKVEVSDAQ